MAAGGNTEVRELLSAVRERVERLLLFRAWERMLEVEFVDRSVALAGKAFVSFFPLVIVVAAFAPDRTRASILGTLTARLGFRGDALRIAREAFASSDDIRKATGLLGLLLTVFYATSFTTALQRVYVRAWRRPSTNSVGRYWRGAAWLLAILAYMAVLGGLRGLLSGSIGFGVFVALSLAGGAGLWTFSPWLLLEGDVRPRALAVTGVITGVALGLYALSASIWMPDVVTGNERQFGFFGVALALVTWFSGASMCVLVGACAGATFAEDSGVIGRFIRGRDQSTLIDGASEPLPPPDRQLRLRDAFLLADGPQDQPDGSEAAEVVDVREAEARAGDD